MTHKDNLTDTIKDIISTEIQRRPVVHLTINLPLDTTTNPEHLADTILKVLQDFQCLPPSPPVSEGSDKPQ